MKATLSFQQNTRSRLQIVHKSNTLYPADSWLNELDQRIEEGLALSSINVGSIASALYTSERGLFRKIKKYTGKTPNAYLQEYRLQKARKLLLSGQFETLKEVCQQIAWKRVDYFSRLFEARFGARPVDLLI